MAAQLEGIISGSSGFRTAYGDAIAAKRNVLPLDRSEPAETVGADIEETGPASVLRELHQGGEGGHAGIDQAVEDANRSAAMHNRSIRFKINREMDDTLQVQIFDSERNKVIRSIPSDELLQLNHRLREYSGLGAMVDESR